MTSLDVRDMLDLPSAAGPRPSKKQKTTGPRPNLKGLQREVQSLKGDNPIAIVPEVPQFKKRRFASRKPARPWELKAFRTTTRSDGLVLHHWRPKSDGAAPVEGEAAESAEVKQEPVEDSLFAKYNVQIERPTYNDEQYESNLRHDDWTKDETDYLMGLTAEFDLRWMVIWDRYEYKPPVSAGSMEVEGAVVHTAKPRSMEELKSRYYTVAAKMFCVNRPLHNQTPDEYAFHEAMVNFDPAQEVARKRFAENTMNRSDTEKREEEMLLAELKRIVNRTEQLNQERKELYARLDAPTSSSNIGMFSSSQGLQTLLQTLLSADKNKKRKTLMAAEGASSPAVGPGAGQQQASGGDRRDSQRESLSGPSAAAKKATGPNERRKLTEEEEAMYGLTHHERLTSGPSFRHEKVTKLLSTRSATQATKLSNALTELEIPSRLAMPTTDVVAAFEQLVGSINLLLEARKVADKIDGEIRMEESKREDRLAAKAAAAAAAAADDGEGEGAVKEEEEEDGDAPAPANADAADGAPAASATGSVRKRSASVMSAHSDKSSKRQKK